MLNNYHWVWYLLGLIFVPRITIMIYISLYLRDFIPFPLFVFGWFFAITIEAISYGR